MSGASVSGTNQLTRAQASIQLLADERNLPCRVGMSRNWLNSGCYGTQKLVRNFCALKLHTGYVYNNMILNNKICFYAGSTDLKFAGAILAGSSPVLGTRK